MHVREELIEAQFTEPLGRLRFDEEIFEWVRESLHPATSTGALRLWRGSNKTVVFVTHSVQEALLLGDDIVVLSKRPATIRTIETIEAPCPRDLAAPELVAVSRRLVLFLAEDSGTMTKD